MSNVQDLPCSRFTVNLTAKDRYAKFSVSTTHPCRLLVYRLNAYVDVSIYTQLVFVRRVSTSIIYDDDFEDVGVKSGNEGIFFATWYDHLLVGRRI